MGFYKPVRSGSCFSANCCLLSHIQYPLLLLCPWPDITRFTAAALSLPRQNKRVKISWLMRQWTCIRKPFSYQHSKSQSFTTFLTQAFMGFLVWSTLAQIISAIIGWITMFFGKNIYELQEKNPTDYRDPLTHLLVPQWGWPLWIWVECQIVKLWPLRMDCNILVTSDLSSFLSCSTLWLSSVLRPNMNCPLVLLVEL